MTAAVGGCDWSAARTLPLGKTQYPFYRRLGGPEDRSGRAENLIFTEVRSRTVHPVAQSIYRLSYPTQTFPFTLSFVSYGRVFLNTNLEKIIVISRQEIDKINMEFFLFEARLLISLRH